MVSNQVVGWFCLTPVPLPCGATRLRRECFKVSSPGSGTELDGFMGTMLVWSGVQLRLIRGVIQTDSRRPLFLRDPEGTITCSASFPSVLSVFPGLAVCRRRSCVTPGDTKTTSACVAGCSICHRGATNVQGGFGCLRWPSPLDSAACSSFVAPGEAALAESFWES